MSALDYIARPNPAPTSTPWGTANYVEQLADEVTFYSTPSHAGYHVTGTALAAIPPAHRRFAARWSHGWGGSWFEEDVAALAVALAHPELFPHLDDDRRDRLAGLLADAIAQENDR